MKKSLFLIIVSLFFFHSYGQENDKNERSVNQSVKDLYAKEVEQTLDFVFDLENKKIFLKYIKKFIPQKK